MSAYQLMEVVRRALSEASYGNHDPVVSVVEAIQRHSARLSATGQGILSRVARVEIHRGTENFYRISFTDMAERDEIDLTPGIVFDLTQKDLAEGSKAFNEKYLQHFDEIPYWEKGEWPGFVRALLHHKNVVNQNVVEDADAERLAVEAFIERAQRWRPVRDLSESVRDESKVYWEEEGAVLLRSSRVEDFLKTSGHKITLPRFAHLLREDGVILGTSIQKKVPATDGSKPRNVRFWRLNAAGLHITEADILAPTTIADDLPPTDADALEGAR